MAKQSGAQKKNIERVMYEFMQCDPENGVRKQAIAIGLKEAGASKYESNAENKRNLERTLQKKENG